MNILKDIFLRHPAIPVAVSLVVGILVGERWQYAEAWIVVAFILATAAIMLRQHGKIMSVAILAGFCCIGAFLASIQQEKMNIILPKGEIAYEAVVITEAREHPKTWSADIAIISGIMKGRTIKAYFSKKAGKPPVPTTHLKAISTLTLPQNSGNDKFNYSLYLRRHGICATTFIAPWKYRQIGFSTDGLSKTTAVTARLRLMRQMLLGRTETWGLHKDTEALIAGVALGQRNAISREMRDTYSQAGAAHVLALSGLHLGIIWAIFGIFFTGPRRMSGIMLSLPAIWAYTMLTGLPPSAVRAAIMLTICSVASLTGRRGASLNALAFAAMIILIANPVAVHDLGVQLSFSAVAFILVFASPFANIVSREWQMRHRIISKLWQMCVLTTVANIGTQPLVIYNFSRVPLYTIATNLVAIPLITILLWLFVVCMLLMVMGIPEMILKSTAWLLDNTAACLNKSMELVASLPYSSIDGINVSAAQTAILYCFFLCISFSLLKSCHTGE